MFKNNFKIAFRNMIKQKGYTFITIFGLTLGMALCILIFRWIRYELSFNTMHEKLDSIYTVRTYQHHGSRVERTSGSVPAFGPAAEAEYPEVINYVRFNNGQREMLFKYGDKTFKERVQMADPSVFEIFTFPFVKGNIKDTYSDPFVVVLNETTAKKYFEDEDPIGKTMLVDNQHSLRIVGVMEDIPFNSTEDFKVWVPIQLSKIVTRENYLDTWYNLAFRTYLQMQDGFSLESFNEKIKGRIRQSRPETNSEPYIYPFKDVYMKIWGREAQIRLFGIIALIVLVIACINFMNLSTARSARRAREVGMRKVVGARRRQLVNQFFQESFLITFFALILSVVLSELFLPLFKSITNCPIKSWYYSDPVLLLGLLAIGIMTGVLAGLYPSVILSGFKPIRVLQNRTLTGNKGSLLRKILVVFQFTLSILLFIITIVIFNQTRFMKNKSLGYDKEQLIYLRIEGNLQSNFQSVKAELTQYPRIQSVSVTSHSPSGIYSNGQDWEWEGRDPNINPLTTYFTVDEDLLKTFKMEMSEGEFFKKTITDSPRDVVINESFALLMGTDSPVGKKIWKGDISLRIIGVIKDFHYKPVYRDIGPIMLFNSYTSKWDSQFLFIRLAPGNIPKAIESIKNIVTRFNPDFPFDYHFLDGDFEQMYVPFERVMSIIRVFAFLAIFISCLGLFGLAAFMAVQRTKEIGIRKVMGATIFKIVIMLSKEFTKLVIISNLIAWPIAFFLMRHWLQDFTYRTPLSPFIFILSALAALLFAWLTVSYQSIRAARANPVEALRYE